MIKILGRYPKNDPLLFDFWDRLKIVKAFHAKTQSKNGKEWTGSGRVHIELDSDVVLTFHERGSWQVKQGQTIAFRNTLRWTFEPSAGIISVEHLRFGPHHPVLLVHLAPAGDHLLASVNAHLCKQDLYLAQVSWDRHHIRLFWQLTGPKKNEEMEWEYTGIV